MRELAALLIHFIVNLARLVGPGGARSVMAETLLIKHQLLVTQRHRQRAPNLTVFDRVFAGLCCLLMNPGRIAKAAIVIRPATLLKFHDALKRRKYRLLFSSKSSRRRPGPKGPSEDLVAAILEMKRRNPSFGCPRIARQLSKAFAIDVDKDVVRRVLARHYRPPAGGGGPSWLTALGHTKDSLWSVDLFRCESLLLRTHWVLVVIDQYTRRIVGFGVQPDVVDGARLCRMFNRVVHREGVEPKRVSTDHDPLFLFNRWCANLRIMDIEEVKTVPYVPLSHPFVERMIGTVRRECLDQVPFWNAVDLERKLNDFKLYYNEHRAHESLDGETPSVAAGGASAKTARLDNYAWEEHCRGLYQLPVAA